MYVHTHDMASYGEKVESNYTLYCNIHTTGTRKKFSESSVPSDGLVGGGYGLNPSL